MTRITEVVHLGQRNVFAGARLVVSCSWGLMRVKDLPAAVCGVRGCLDSCGGAADGGERLMLTETYGLLAKSCLLRKSKVTGFSVYGHRGVVSAGMWMLTPNER